MKDPGSHVGAMGEAQHAEQVLQLHQELLVASRHSPQDTVAEAVRRKGSWVPVYQIL